MTFSLVGNNPIESLSNFISLDFFVDWIGFEPMVLPEWEQFYRLSASTACIPIQICFLGGFATTGLPVSFVQTLGLNNITIERQLHYSNHIIHFS